MNQLEGPWHGYRYGIPVLVSEGLYTFVVAITKKMGGTDPYTIASKALSETGNTFATAALIELGKGGRKETREIAKHYLEKTSK